MHIKIPLLFLPKYRKYLKPLLYLIIACELYDVAGKLTIITENNTALYTLSLLLVVVSLTLGLYALFTMYNLAVELKEKLK